MMMKTAYKGIFLVALLFLGGCAAEQQAMRVLWPPLPERPRMEWIQVLYSEDDFSKSKKEKLVEKMVGPSALPAFKRPFGIASDGTGRVYVSDVDDRSVKVVDFNSRSILPLTGARSFGIPLGLALDQKKNLYVADAGARSVMVFTPEHRLLLSFGNEHLTKPAYLALKEDMGRIYVSDGMAHKIAVFDSKGKFLFEFGERGAGDGQFTSPQGLAFDRQGRLYVADQHNARIQVFDAEGKFLSKFGERGDKQWHFEGPKDLAFDSEGNLHILDYRKSALVTYTPDGKLLLFTGGGGPTTSPVAFALPSALFIDSGDRIYIADSFNQRIALWQYLSDAYIAAHPFDEATRKAQEELLRKKIGK